MRSLPGLSLLGALVACGSASGGSSFSSQGARKQDASADAASVDAADAGACVTDAGTGYLCDESVAGYCAKWDGSSCSTTWQSVRAQTPCAGAGDGVTISFAACGALNMMSISGIDNGVAYFYDANSGALAAIVSFEDPGGFACAAGPSCFAWNCGPVEKWSCGDGGADGGHVGQ